LSTSQILGSAFQNATHVSPTTRNQKRGTGLSTHAAPISNSTTHKNGAYISAHCSRCFLLHSDRRYPDFGSILVAKELFVVSPKLASIGLHFSIVLVDMRDGEADDPSLALDGHINPWEQIE
jgi:hypothetical protein